MKDYVAIATDYANAVVSKQKVCGRLEMLACNRFLTDLVRAQDPACSFTFDAFEANKPCAFVEQLHHVEGVWEKGAGRIELEPWQVFLLVNVFGFRRADGTRRFNTAYIEVARKNAKSTLSSAMALYCLTMEGETGPQIKCAATTGDQARIVFDVMAKMVERNVDIREAFKLEVFANAIACGMNGGSVKPINAKASTQDGLNPHLTIIDELHAHKERALFDVLRSARGARKNPLSWYITTAGYQLEGVCYEQREMVVKILTGIFDADHYFGIVYTLDEGDDPLDEVNWAKANPNLGVSVDLEELRGYATEAKNSAETLGEFKTKRLNVWLSASHAWLNITQWDACADKTIRIEDFKHQPCWIAVDLASKDDIAAVVPVFLRDGTLHAFPHMYLPQAQIMSDAQRYAHYIAWANAGHFTLTDGDLIDYDRIEADIRELVRNYQVRKIAFDPFQATQMVGRLSNDGLPAITMPNTVKSLSDPAKELEARIKAKRFRHDGNPAYRWQASNVTVRRDLASNIFPRKAKPNSSDKIDAIVATIMAIGQMLNDLPEVGAYDGPGLIVF
jgi:phage terminase large subunit-like protein